MTAWTERRYAVIDVEGNGHHPPDLVELGVLPIVGGTAGELVAWLFKPEQPITAMARHIHGISNDAVATAPVFAEMAAEVSASLDGVVVAHNAGIDLGVLKRKLPGFEPSEVLDTLKLARRSLPEQLRPDRDAPNNVRRARRWGGTVSRRADVVPSGTHNGGGFGSGACSDGAQQVGHGRQAANITLVVSELVTNAVLASTDADGRPKYMDGSSGLPVVHLRLTSDHMQLVQMMGRVRFATGRQLAGHFVGTLRQVDQPGVRLVARRGGDEGGIRDAAPLPVHLRRSPARKAAR
jgi:hypothetical protein